ncbi:hypothetical protein KR50_20210 [Jeotgalibacillus campisalis]|uniref:Uncharacterized protein n=1 Tax=Jeotgalibacillus campisalis TaxID=220754 RepID=A0A0C2S1C6_9BACL|nr:hypothetical protein KR50_20210 [Jeotgalibacillus campisalis]
MICNVSSDIVTIKKQEQEFNPAYIIKMGSEMYETGSKI